MSMQVSYSRGGTPLQMPTAVQGCVRFQYKSQLPENLYPRSWDVGCEPTTSCNIRKVQLRLRSCILVFLGQSTDLALNSDTRVGHQGAPFVTSSQYGRVPRKPGLCQCGRLPPGVGFLQPDATPRGSLVFHIPVGPGRRCFSVEVCR